MAQFMIFNNEKVDLLTHRLFSQNRITQRGYFTETKKTAILILKVTYIPYIHYVNFKRDKRFNVIDYLLFPVTQNITWIQ